MWQKLFRARWSRSDKSAGRNKQGSSPTTGGCPPQFDFGGGFPGDSSDESSDAEAMVTVTVIRSRLWTGVDEDDVLRLDVPSDASLRDIKARIHVLFGLPAELQRLQLSDSIDGKGLSDKRCVATYMDRTLYLMPNRVEMIAQADPALQEVLQVERAIEAEIAEQQRSLLALQQELRAAVYRLTFVEAKRASDEAVKSSLQLDVNALALVGEVQAMVESELFGVSGREHVHLVYRGQPLPLDVPIHFAGIRDGQTVTVTHNAKPMQEDGYESDSSADSLNDGMLAWAAGG